MSAPSSSPRNPTTTNPPPWTLDPGPPNAQTCTETMQCSKAWEVTDIAHLIAQVDLWHAVLIALRLPFALKHHARRPFTL
jgi:hypothetical protein